MSDHTAVDSTRAPEWLKLFPGKALRYGCLFGGLVFVAGLFLAPERIWPSFLVSEMFLLTLGLGAMIFIAVTYVSNGTWGTVLRRVPEAMSNTVPVASVIMIALLFGVEILYPWTDDALMHSASNLEAKIAWLNLPFFLLRTAIYLIIWVVFQQLFLRWSRQQDQSKEPALTVRAFRFSAVFLALFAVTFSFAAFDWLMSLEPHWYSSIFAIYVWSGTFLGGIAAITFVVILLIQAGAFRNRINEHHLHDLGKLLFAFSCFWAYIWFSQYLLIWYSNIPEEASYYVLRHQGAWGSLSFINLFLNFVIPFFFLISIKAKKNPKMLLFVSGVVLFGHWLDLFIMVGQGGHGQDPALGIWEIGPMIGVLTLFMIITLSALGRNPLIPQGDPTLADSLHHHG